MGDRANVVVEFDYGPEAPKPPPRVYLYTHWRGSALPSILQRALARRMRWDDPSYLARIIFCEMVKGQEGEETGFGISPDITDNEHPLLVVNTRHRLVRLEPDRDRPWANRDDVGDIAGLPDEPPRAQQWSFDEFVRLDLKAAFRGY